MLPTVGLFSQVLFMAGFLLSSVDDSEAAKTQGRQVSGIEVNETNVFQLRKQHLQTTCNKYKDLFRPEYYALYGSDVKTINLTRNYFTWKDKQYLFLALWKGGSVSWYFHFQNLKIPTTVYCSTCSRKTLDKVILQVRHPLERLLSAYRQQIQEDAWRLYRGNQSEGLGEILGETSMSWQEFVEMVLRHSFTPADRENDTEYFYNGVAREDFQSVVPAHWAPYWLTVSYCSPQFIPDIILKMETLDDDYKHLQKIIGLPADTAFPNFPVKGLKNPNTQHSSKLAEQYYSQLTKQQILGLSEIYKLDLEMFDYSSLPYLRYAKE